jgi:metal-sulfur cluster biosynthetic enzyme
MSNISIPPTSPVTEEQVYTALRECYDPEIPVNIVDLGLVYGVTIVDDWVGVKMTLTTPGCGLADMIVHQVRTKILSIPGVQDGDVRLVWQPAWHPGMISEAAKQQLNIKE